MFLFADGKILTEYSDNRRRNLHEVPVSVEVGVYSSAAALPESTKALLRHEGAKDLFSSEQWFDLLLQNAWEGGKPLLYAARDTSSPASDCVLFVAQKNDSRRLRGVSNFYTMRYGPILHGASVSASSLDAILDAVTRSRPAWTALDLQKLIADEPATLLLTEGLRRRGWSTHTYFQSENWYERTAGLSGKDYFASRPSQMRNTIERKWRKANREHQVAVAIHTEIDGLNPAIAAYEAVYAQSWKNAERYPNFIANFLRVCAARGVLRLGVAHVDDIPAAAQIWLVCGGRATIYKLAYDERFASLSIGSALTRMMFDHVLDKDHVEEVDYGTGSEPYKRDWMSRKRDVVGLIAYNPRTIEGLVGASRHGLGRFVRKFARASSSDRGEET